MTEQNQFAVEVVMIPVSDVDRAKEFYTETLGFPMDGDIDLEGGRRFVQVTPPGSSCSIAFGTNITNAAPGSYRETYIVVADIQAARAELVARGAEIDEIVHFTREGTAAGPDPKRRDYGSIAHFSDPDGNTFMLQEVPSRASDVAPDEEE
jgi:catechol 2,3-dioxygenase-like lactoylglutathione lyase family enzyme